MKEIPGYSRYKALVNGDVFSNYKRSLMKKILSMNGYYWCTFIGDNGRRRGLYVHRIIALAFIENPHNKPCINHKDGNKLNNHYTNLEWCTHKENSRHAKITGLWRNRYLGENSNAKTVLNRETGIYYDTLHEAVESTGGAYKKSCLSMQLIGKNSNRSPFIYV